MRIIDFAAEHVEQARMLAQLNYDEERSHVPLLPKVHPLPGPGQFAENNLGICAMEGDEMLGFLCCYEPFAPHFGNCTGVYSPTHAHGAIKQNRSRIYDAIYQAAAEKWVAKNILSHALTLYAHDDDALSMFFNNNFGKRCVDAVREVKMFAAVPTPGIDYRAATVKNAAQIAELIQGLHSHLNQTPMFMPYFQNSTPEEIEALMCKKDIHYFAAFDGECMVAYMKIQRHGENFATEVGHMRNISGAFCLPEYRGRGIYAMLLLHVMEWLAANGFTRCGVDFESFNPTARGFWLKHFEAYTFSVTRRIDERILEKH